MPRNTIDFQISDKVFAKSDFEKLVSLLSSSYVKRRKPELAGSYQTLTLKVESTDGISTEFDERDIKSAVSLFESKKVTLFKGSYFDIQEKSQLSISLDESKYGINNVSVSSGDKMWFNAKRTEMKDFIDSVKDQSNFYLSHRTLSKFLIRVAAGLPFSYLIIFYVLPLWYSLFPPDPPVNPVAVGSPSYIFAWVILAGLGMALNYVVGMLAADKLIEKIESMWPSIEFNFGPDHQNKPRRSREIVKSIATILVIPIIITAVFMIIDRLT